MIMLWKWKKGEENYYEEIFNELEKNKVDYLLIGGLAVALYGIPRVTGDLDLMLNMEPQNLEKFIKVMKKMGFKPKAPVNPEDLADAKKREDWIKTKNMKVFSFQHPNNSYVLIDVMIDNPLNYQEAAEDKKLISCWGTKIYLIPKKLLIKMKKLAGRQQDLSDIEALLKSEEE
ncbi:MAG: hypothetical protein FD145_1124 [Candidatus Saganbacteria bacterium]|uniref:Nucleotidyltransferase family protein n=1 Tax=Candidatus Saganbacteria bacterium TaxID=2575572 RepID=A0A833NZQ8_UNCSA|nr:MAG: hypothetical protein FD145_1124 [Candidatus Saganbacteria bacterium]